MLKKRRQQLVTPANTPKKVVSRIVGITCPLMPCLQIPNSRIKVMWDHPSTPNTYMHLKLILHAPWYTQMVTSVKDKNIFDTPVRNANKRMPCGMAVRILLIKWSGFIFINITNTHSARVEVSSTSSHCYWELASSLTWYNPNLTWGSKRGCRPSQLHLWHFFHCFAG